MTKKASKAKSPPKSNVKAKGKKINNLFALKNVNAVSISNGGGGK
jgi:hypothetical protein